MEANYIAIIGFFAGTCTTLSFLPQLVKTVRSKETKNLSMLMYVVLATGLFLWMVYGIMIGAFPIILANAVSFAFALVILVLKFRYG